MSATMDRRSFLKAGAAVSGGLVLGFKLPLALAKDAPARDPDDVNAWLQIGTDGTVTIMVPSAEIGQGVYTSAPMLIAEELECDWRRVRAQIAPTDPVYANRMFRVQATASSTSARWSFDPLRRIGATARMMLVQAAAQQWQVPTTECRAQLGRVTHLPSGRSLGYGELAPAAARLPRPTEVQLKDKSQWTLIGRPVARLDIPLKTRGAAQFGVDVAVPGMLVGTVAACPALGGTLRRVDARPALAVRGVKQVVPLRDAVVVLGDSYWTAKRGLERLQPDWQLPETPSEGQALAAGFRRAAAEGGALARHNGAPEAKLAGAGKRIEAQYEVPYLAHAAMEPMNATADVRGDRAEIWGPTQVCGEIAHRLAPLLNLPEERIVVHSTFAGGGFGRREEFDVFIQAALASKAAGKPVKLIWSREEDVQHDFYRPAAAARFAATLGANGAVEALEARLACSSIYIRNFPDRVKNGVDPKSVEGVVDVPYALPDFAVRYAMTNTAVPVGFWRGVGYTQNCFFFESFVDELAHAAGQDPLAFRLGMLADKPRHGALLTRLAERAGWHRKQPGRHFGVALSEAWGSICGTIVELSLEQDQRIRIHRISCAVDCGTVINPATVERQLEGSSIWALSAALWGEVTVRDGRIQQSNFHDYPVLQLAQTPPIDSLLIESGAKIGGVGESGVPPLAPALTNALFAATGKRIRSLPLAKQGYELA